ncbi:MAG TPA: futalosine hydrolase [Desulfobacteraceae bacterium]|nr:futalosine hydrolase [Desulfobacteraceae bacterium]HDL98036.1 futalosine hydrolase [Desulfobacteraceae bacterium]HDO30259.1 futalosine hydrolase [Desulfobacteraceae bacterium]HDZ76413.1 futalosine hydrolase [Desulfobacteraceae bacterium]
MSMYLVTSATENEMQPFQAVCPGGAGVRQLVTGLGPLETAVRLYSWLSRHPGPVSGVINFGVAGAYTGSPGLTSPRLLDICLAEREVLGDLGICFADRVERFSDKKLGAYDTFTLNRELLAQARLALDAENIFFHSGTFVTVNCASGTARRGVMLAAAHRGLCENMEGAAVARVCEEFNLPCLELRCISNMVEDRDPGRWQLAKACVRAAEVTAALVRRLPSRPSRAAEE